MRMHHACVIRNGLIHSVNSPRFAAMPFSLCPVRGGEGWGEGAL
jgi:hypothetical protein